MRKRTQLALLTFVLTTAFVAASALTATPAVSKNCPRNSHLVTCPTYSFCCPNNALCVCL